MSPAVCQGCNMKPAKALPWRVWAWESRWGEERLWAGACGDRPLHSEVVSVVERDEQALFVHESQQSAVLCRCSINSGIWSHNSSLWCLGKNLFYSKKRLGRGVTHCCFCCWMLCFSFCFSQLCPKTVSEICFYFQPCRNPSWVETMPKLLELGNIQRYAKMIKIIPVLGNS